MAGPTPHYPPEFGREAVELYRSSEKSIPKVAEEFGIASESLRRWIGQYEADSGARGAHHRRAGGTEQAASGEQDPKTRARFLEKS